MDSGQEIKAYQSCGIGAGTQLYFHHDLSGRINAAVHAAVCLCPYCVSSAFDVQPNCTAMDGPRITAPVTESKVQHDWEALL